MSYKLIADSEVVKKIVEGQNDLYIPNEPENKDWQEYQEWIALGNEPEAAD